MKIATQTGVIDRAYGAAVTIKMIADAGFEAMDYSLTGKAIPWNEGIFTDPFGAEFIAYFKSAAKAVTDHGIEICQTHAPYCRPFCCDPDAYTKVLQQTIRAVYATAYMNCPYIVVHPILHPDFNNGQNREQGILANLKYFNALAPALKDTGVIMCIENLYWGELNKPKIANACSDAEQLGEVIDTLKQMHGPYFAACLDTGHAVISGNDPSQMLRALGNRVCTLHLHDTYGIFDDHLLPGKGVINWQEFMQTLTEIGYKGTFNFEVDTYLEDFAKDIYNKAVMEDAIKLLYTVGRSMLKMTEKGLQ